MIDNLLANHPIISGMVSKRDLSVVLNKLYEVICKNISGDIVELGCNIGTTSLFIERLRQQLDSGNKYRFYVYDSFEGLPEKTPIDEPPVMWQNYPLKYAKGTCKTNLESFTNAFIQAKLQLPQVNVGWFSEIAECHYPKSVAFAFFDGDFYSSITDSFRIIWNKISSNGAVVVHDYEAGFLPGVKRAVTDFLSCINPVSYKLESINGLAVITKFG